LEIIRTLTVNGATDCVIEFRGPVVDAFTMEERMTLCNMAIEAGGTSEYACPTRRPWIICGRYQERLQQ